MKKTYWWRILLGVVAIVILSSIDFIGDAANSALRLREYDDFLGILSMEIVIVSIFTFLINDIIFVKWLRFLFLWIIIATALIIISSVSDAGSRNLFPDEDYVAMLVGYLFIVASFVKIALDIWKQDKYLEKTVGRKINTIKLSIFLCIAILVIMLFFYIVYDMSSILNGLM